MRRRPPPTPTRHCRSLRPPVKGPRYALDCVALDCRAPLPGLTAIGSGAAKAWPWASTNRQPSEQKRGVVALVGAAAT